MKQFYILLIFILFSLNCSISQTVTVTGSCYGPVDGDYVYDGDVNGKPSFFNDTGSSTNYVISWTGSRWELNSTNAQLGCHNDLDTPNPPATSLSPWTPDGCNPTGVFTGDGTSTTLSTEDFNTESLKIYPIPSKDFVTIIGLQGIEDYSIYSVLGEKMLEGSINNYGEIDINNFSSGTYIIIFDTGNRIKFIKN